MFDYQLLHIAEFICVRRGYGLFAPDHRFIIVMNKFFSTDCFLFLRKHRCGVKRMWAISSNFGWPEEENVIWLLFTICVT